MKTFLTIVLVVIAISLSNCKKSGEPATLTNCNDLINDTIGTNDTARLFIQNAFTPNGDGLNDVSRVLAKGISSITFSVYDDNNTVVFTTSQISGPGMSSIASTEAWAPAANTSTFETYHYRVQATTNSNHHIGVCGELYKLACRPSNISLSNLYFEDQLLLNGTYSPSSIESLATCP